MADKNSYLSRVTYKGGKDSYEFQFSYLRKDFVKAQIDVSEHESNTLAYLVDYTIDGHTIKLKKPVDADKTITIYRETSSTPLVEYEDSSILRAYDLNLSQRQNLNILEEQTDIVEDSLKVAKNGGIGYRLPSTVYAVGTIAYHASLPTGWCLKCTTAGITSAGDITPSSTIGDTITDGGVTWTVVKYALTTDVPPLASALATPRKIELTGNVTGSADFDGSKDIQIVAATPLCIPLSEHITWTVTGTQQGDFDSLQTALNEAKKYRPIAEGALITIKLLSGFELDEPIRVSRCDLRHVEITAEDSKVIANTSKVAALMPTVPDYSLWSVRNFLGYIQFYKAFAPTLRFILRKDNNNGSGYHNCNGVEYIYSQGYIDGGGCENFKIGGNECYGVNITCSNLSVIDSTFSDCWGGVTSNKNSSLHVMNSTFTDFLSRGISLWGGIGEIQGCTIANASQDGILFEHCEASISEYNTESDSADTRRTKISNCSCGVNFDFGGTAAINRVDITGCSTGVLLEDSGNLVRMGADTNISGNTNNYNIATNTITSQGLILTA